MPFLCLCGNHAHDVVQAILTPIATAVRTTRMPKPHGDKLQHAVDEAADTGEEETII
jgi:hypothetical protein